MSPKKHENDNQNLIDEQFRFRKQCSTVHQLSRITNFISNNFNIKTSTAMALLDIEKAFDTVWHRGLILKLYKLNLPTYIIKNNRKLSHRQELSCINRERHIQKTTDSSRRSARIDPRACFIFILHKRLT